VDQIEEDSAAGAGCRKWALWIWEDQRGLTRLLDQTAIGSRVADWGRNRIQGDTRTWIVGGYNVAGFSESGFGDSDRRAAGPFLSVRFKFDRDWGLLKRQPQRPCGRMLYHQAAGPRLCRDTPAHHRRDHRAGGPSASTRLRRHGWQRSRCRL
jgi:hypothetical protein